MAEERGAALKKLIRENRGTFIILIALFLALPVMTISDINKMESGQSVRERLIIPVGWIYHSLGYWPAVLFLPLCYLAGAAYIIRKFILTPKK